MTTTPVQQRGFVSILIDGNGWPPVAPGQWRDVRISFDAQRQPQVTAAIDGEAVPYEQGPDGVWRVKP